LKKLLFVLPLVLMLAACGSDNTVRARSLREKLLTEKGCAFSVAVTADYTTEQYDFSMDCTWSREAGVVFTVTSPETVSGITGTLAENGGELTFDDKVLAFQYMADGQISPVQVPYVIMHTLTGGYFKTCTVGSGKYCLDADCTYRENSIAMSLWLSEDSIPQNGELFWEGNRIVSFTVEGFRFL